MKRQDLITVIVLALPFLVLLPSMGDFPFRSTEALYTDYAVTHYPNAVFLMNSLRNFHQIPLWSPSILSGFPFFANPLSGLLYPPGWLAFMFPLPFGFNLVLAIHLVWGGYGMYRFIRAEGLSRWAALFSGLGFALMPKIFAHYGAGHLTLLYAIAWTPWLLYCEATRPGFRYRNIKFDIPIGLILGLIFLADVRWSVYAGVLWVAYVIAYRYDEAMHRTLLRLLGQAGIAFLVAAPLALPLIEYTLLSSRLSMGVKQVGAFSLPLANLAGLLFPDFHGNHEWVIYAGGVGLALSVVAVTTPIARPRMKFWGLIVISSLVFALGEALPGFNWLARMPGFDLLRAPSRAMFVAGMGFTALAGFGIEFIYSAPDYVSRRNSNLALVALLALTQALGLGFALLGERWTVNITWGMVFSLSGVAWIMIGLQKRVPNQVWLVGVFCLAILDWGGDARLSFTPRSPQLVIADKSELAGYLASRKGLFRIYSPSYSMPQQTAALFDLQLADGVDPMQLEVYAELIEQASGVPRAGYHVTIPTFASGNPSQDNAAYLPDLKALGMLNVAYVVSEFDIHTEDLDLIAMVGETRIYKNRFSLPRAWVQPDRAPLGDDTTSAPINLWSPNRIELSAQGPGWLVLSELAYPGWQAYIDGEKQPLVEFDGLFRGVKLDAGSHKVVFRIVPWTLYLGLFLQVTGIGLYWLIKIRQNVRRSV